jgi:iron-sulfur cluster assembly accessory protein
MTIITNMQTKQKLFDITEEARNQMTKMLAKNKDKYAITLLVNGGGCAGFKYEWKFINDKDEVGDDDYVDEWDGGRFVVDEMSILYVAGTKIDWVEEVFGSQFQVSNPNSTASCGCGESFGV